jgi:hypothetical protein
VTDERRTWLRAAFRMPQIEYAVGDVDAARAAEAKAN